MSGTEHVYTKYSGIFLNWISLGQNKVLTVVRCPHFRGCTQIAGWETLLFMEGSSI